MIGGYLSLPSIWMFSVHVFWSVRALVPCRLVDRSSLHCRGGNCYHLLRGHPLRHGNINSDLFFTAWQGQTTSASAEFWYTGRATVELNLRYRLHLSERFSFVGPAIFPIFSTWQHAQTIRQHHPTAVYWGWRSVFPQFEHKHFHTTTSNTTATANTASLTFMGSVICPIL